MASASGIMRGTHGGHPWMASMGWRPLSSIQRLHPGISYIGGTHELLTRTASMDAIRGWRSWMASLVLGWASMDGIHIWHSYMVFMGAASLGKNTSIIGYSTLKWSLTVTPVHHSITFRPLSPRGLRYAEKLASSHPYSHFSFAFASDLVAFALACLFSDAGCSLTFVGLMSKTCFRLYASSIIKKKTRLQKL